MQKKKMDAEPLKELETLLLEDVKRTRNRGQRLRNQWMRIGTRLGVYFTLIMVFYFLKIFANLRIALAVVLFFIFIEMLRYYRLDTRILKLFQWRRRQ